MNPKACRVRRLYSGQVETRAQPRVMEEDGHAVGGQVDVSFERSCTCIERGLEAGQRILGPQPAGAAMALNHEGRSIHWDGPGAKKDLAGPQNVALRGCEKKR